ncbi:hypothetical protein CCZ01_02800 [Helicobacter monodelphidis]|uniref:O-methyltransferase n=1 Tax=Helicobacter sp. 15-1451 TaxID=2004995 RepID=UPI000DCC8919|nr:class I SAM-dependent methyltransferase [Helicobacter sp. 15-1451]RAX58362.1 hypothetical protein CCZ01_02800 [Helicobacter sp. 15-1451]
MQEFQVISDRVEQRREILKQDKTLIEVLDYGAGNPEDRRSKAQMQEGVCVQVPLCSLASIGVKREKAQILYSLFSKYYPQRILELGTCCGFSSVYMSLFAPQAYIHTIEGSPNTAEIAKQNHTFFKCQNIQIHIGRFDSVLPSLLPQIVPIDFAFIDGHHDKDATLEYFRMILPFMAQNSIMLFDDIAWNELMQEAWKEILALKHHSSMQDFGTMGAIWL